MISLCCFLPGPHRLSVSFVGGREPNSGPSCSFSSIPTILAPAPGAVVSTPVPPGTYVPL